MDTVNDRDIESIVIMSSAQVGKTEILNKHTWLSYCPRSSTNVVVMPTLEMARAFSTQRLSKMITASDALRGKVKDSKVEIVAIPYYLNRLLVVLLLSQEVTHQHHYHQDHVGLFLLDEVDRYQPTPEGDPVDLARKRTSTFGIVKS